MSSLIIVFTLFLVGISILDFKYKAVPSIFLTLMLIILSFLRFDNIQWVFILTLFGLFLWELSHENKTSFGLADIKVMAMMGFFINSVWTIGVFLILFSVSQLIYFTLIRSFIKNENEILGISQEVPFIPVLLVLWLIGLIGGLWVW